MNTITRTPAVACSIMGAVLTLTFADGRTLHLDATTLSPEVREYAMMHGLKQKLVDAAAMSRNPDTGRSATLDDKYRAVETVFNRIITGAWNAVRGEGGTGSGGLLFRALCRAYPAKTPETIKEYLDGKDAKQQAALRATPKIAAIIEKIKAEDAANTEPDTRADAMLDELESM